MAEEVDFGDPLNPSEAAMRLSSFASPPEQGQDESAVGMGGSEQQQQLPFAQPPAPAAHGAGAGAAPYDAAPVQLAPAAVTTAPVAAPSPAAAAAVSLGASAASAAGSLFERIRAAQAQAQTGGAASPSRAAPLMSGEDGGSGLHQQAGAGPGSVTFADGGADAGGSSALGSSSRYFTAHSSSSFHSSGDGSANGGTGAVPAGEMPSGGGGDPSAGYDTGTFYASRSELQPQMNQPQPHQLQEAAGAPTPTVPGSGGLRVPSYAPISTSETAHAPYSAGESTSDKALTALGTAWDVASRFGSKAARAGSRAAGSLMEKARGENGGAGGNSSLLEGGGVGVMSGTMGGGLGGSEGGAEMTEAGMASASNLGGSGTAFGTQFSGGVPSSSDPAAAGAAAGPPDGAVPRGGGYGRVSTVGQDAVEGGGGGQEYNMWAYLRMFCADLCGLIERAPLWLQSILLLFVIFLLWSILK